MASNRNAFDGALYGIRETPTRSNAGMIDCSGSVTLRFGGNYSLSVSTRTAEQLCSPICFTIPASMAIPLLESIASLSVCALFTDLTPGDVSGLQQPWCS